MKDYSVVLIFPGEKSSVFVLTSRHLHKFASPNNNYRGT